MLNLRETERSEGSNANHLPWRPGNLLLIFGAWTLLSALISTSVLFDSSEQARNQPFPTVRIVFAFVEAYLWAALTPLIFWLVRRFSSERYSVLTLVLVLSGAGIVLAVSVGGVTQLLRQLFIPGDSAKPFSMLSAIGITIEALTYTAIVVAGFARHYLIRFQDHREQAIALRAQLTDARLTALRAQLNPHFLFNTLHAISALSESDPAGVRRMISRLSELLRISFNEADRPETTLRRELLFVRQYLELMRMQLQSNIEINEDIDDDALEALVPTFLLQPLVENALKHGVSRISDPGRLNLTVQCADGRLTIIIRNNGPFTSIATPIKEGIGLRNTRERLAQLYGADQHLVFHTIEEAGKEFTTEVTFPFHTLVRPRITQQSGW